MAGLQQNGFNAKAPYLETPAGQEFSDCFQPESATPIYKVPERTGPRGGPRDGLVSARARLAVRRVLERHDKAAHPRGGPAPGVEAHPQAPGDGQLHPQQWQESGDCQPGRARGAVACQRAGPDLPALDLLAVLDQQPGHLPQPEHVPGGQAVLGVHLQPNGRLADPGLLHPQRDPHQGPAEAPALLRLPDLKVPAVVLCQWPEAGLHGGLGSLGLYY